MSVQRILLAVILLAALAWIGLGVFTYIYAPETLTCIIFLGLLWPAAFATLTPLAYYLQRRLSRPGNERGKLGDAMREAGLLAVLLVIGAGLRMIESLNWMVMLIMLGVVILVEVRMFIRRK